MFCLVDAWASWGAASGAPTTHPIDESKMRVDRCD
jgi:hypothetical protein